VTDGPPITFVTPVLPAAHGNGLAMRAGLFLEGLSRSHTVAVAVIPLYGTATSGDGLVASLASSCVTIELIAPAQAGTWPSVLLGTAEGRRRAQEIYPLPAICCQASQDGRAQLRALVERSRLVHIMRSYLAPCLDFVFDDDTRPPVTLDVDELDSAVQRQLGSGEQAERFERLERYYLPRVDRVYTASSEDAPVVRQTYGVDRVSVVANAVRAPAATTPVQQRYDLLFVGNLSYEPNIDAAVWLCEQIRPLLGAVTIAIVGSRPAPEVLALAGLPGVSVAGDVPEVTPWYRKARVAVAPLRIGGGTRIKIIEALAHGRPVVATPLGASGLAVGEEHGVIAAATAAEFATACKRLLRDSSAAGAIAAAGGSQVALVEDVADQIDRLTCATINGE
jgi:glycosyltransferase involved in cell wall biosynthesis